MTSLSLLYISEKEEEGREGEGGKGGAEKQLDALFRKWYSFLPPSVEMHSASF